MIYNIRVKLTKLFDRLIINNRDDYNQVIKIQAFFASWIGTVIVMWLYVLFCSYAFGPTHNVTIFGLGFTILHSLVPLLFYLTQSLIPSSLLLSLTGLGFQTIFCVYSGGVYSPAAIWLALHPVILGFFGSIYLIIFSVILNSIIIIGMYLLGNANSLPIDVLPHFFRHLMIISSYIGLDILVATFTIATLKSNALKNAELKKSKDLTENLLRVLAHDINNPLTVLRYYIVKLNKESSKLNPMTLEPTVLEHLNKSSDDIQKITESVSIWISHRDGKVILNPEPISTDELIKHIQLTFEEKLKIKNITINFKESKNLIFLGDKNAIYYQVFNNLISNAIKFSHHNSYIDINFYKSKNRIVFEIRDHGLGISDDLAKKVFSPYEATNRRGTSNEKGTGFGLPIVTTLLKNMDGEIKLEDIKKYFPSENGVIVTVTLPLQI